METQQATPENHTCTVKVSNKSSSSDTQQVLSSRAVTKCLFSNFLAMVSITTALLLATMRRPLYVVSSGSQDEKGHHDDLNIYSSGVACEQQVQCVSSSAASALVVQHCRRFPLLNNCAHGDRLLTLEKVRFSMDLTLVCLSLFVLLFIAGRVFTVISHNATLNRIMLGLASAFAALNSILSIALFHVGQCGVSSDHITRLADVTHTTRPITINHNDDPIGWSSAAVVFSTPLSSFTAALLLGTVAVSYNNVDSKITQLSSQAQTRLMVAQLIVTFLVALFCCTFCSPVFFSS